MKRVSYHLIIPTVMAVAFFVVALMPVQVLGCFMRGLIALVIASVSGLAALGAAIIGVKGRARGDKNAIWWVTSTLILVIPVIAMIIIA
jgi:heme O synthase-like polyprenyltransferase